MCSIAAAHPSARGFWRQHKERRDPIEYFIDFGVLALIYGRWLLPKWRRQDRAAVLVNTAMYVYLCLVLYVTVMPVLCSVPFVLNHPYKPMNLIPFVDVTMGRGDFVRQVVLNVVMTVPLGFLYPLCRGGRAGFFSTAQVCLLLSLGIELIQPFFGRSADITDLVTNLTGGVVGYGLYLLFRPLALWLLERLRR